MIICKLRIGKAGDSNLHCHRRDNLKSHIVNILYRVRSVFTCFLSSSASLFSMVVFLFNPRVHGQKLGKRERKHMSSIYFQFVTYIIFPLWNTDKSFRRDNIHFKFMIMQFLNRITLHKTLNNVLIHHINSGMTWEKKFPIRHNHSSENALLHYHMLSCIIITKTRGFASHSDILTTENWSGTTSRIQVAGSNKIFNETTADGRETAPLVGPLTHIISTNWTINSAVCRRTVS